MINLINGDCVAELQKMIADGITVDCVVTDPAYEVISGGNKTEGAPVGILKENDGKIFEHNDIKPSDWIPPLYDVLKDPAHAYIMTNFLNLQDMMNVCTDSGFKLHNLLVWKKNNATPNRWYMKNVEYTILARKGKAFSINNKGSMTCIEVKNTKDRIHPTQKPIELIEEYVLNSTQEGDTVLDPFLGSGSTGVVCKKHNRNFIGIELDPTYYVSAKKRIDDFSTDSLFTW